MRNIKFRAWDNFENRMYENVQFGIYQDPDEIIIFGDILSLARFEIMQYTGLKDKNGKEIYEGDIVRTELGYAQIIVWSDMYAAFVAEYPNGDRPYRVDCTDEIIGNVHENKDLLEGEK